VGARLGPGGLNSAGGKGFKFFLFFFLFSIKNIFLNISKNHNNYIKIIYN
jgi:hypothetical protein